MLFIVSLAGLTIILAIFEMLFEDAIVLAVACLTTTGPIIEVIGRDELLISDLSFIPKLTLAVGMVLGRLEILVVLSLIAFGFKRAWANFVPTFSWFDFFFEYFKVSQIIIKGKAP